MLTLFATQAIPAPERPSAQASLMAGVPSDYAGWRLAKSGVVTRAFTCHVDSIAESCPAVDELEALQGDMLDTLNMPPNKRFLFYGPSYMLQMFQATVAANVHNIRQTYTQEDYLLQEYNVTLEPLLSGCASTSTKRAATAVSLREKSSDPKICNTMYSPQECRIPREHNVVVLNNGAVLFHFSNQQENDGDMKNLGTFLSTVVMDRIFFMMPHGLAYFNEHCAAEREGRAAQRENMDIGDGDMCFRNQPGMEGPMASPTTPDGYQMCFKKTKIWQTISYNVAQNAQTKMIIVMPHQVMPHGMPSIEGYYYQAPAAKKYACSTGDSLPTGYGFAQGYGPCTSANTNAFFKVGHPCVVVCEGEKCVPGAAAQAAAEMVGFASDEPWKRERAELHERNTYVEWRGVTPHAGGFVESIKYPGYTKLMENSTYPCGEAKDSL